MTRIKLTLLGPCVRAAQGACVKATLVSVVLREWYGPRGSVAMVRSTPGARGRRSREERGGRSAQAHTHARTRTRTGTMEKRTPLGRIFPSNGTRVFTSLLILHGLSRECIRVFVLFYVCTFPPVFDFRLPEEVVAEPLGVSLSPPDTEQHAGLVELNRAVFRSEPASLNKANGNFGPWTLNCSGRKSAAAFMTGAWPETSSLLLLALIAVIW